MIKHTLAGLLMFSSVSQQDIYAKYSQVGIASWYGNENKTSSTGKRLNNKHPGVAHKILPIGTTVRITDIKTMKMVTAVVVDRGPFTKNRIVDLNYAAAKQLGILKRGTAKVIVQVN